MNSRIRRILDQITALEDELHTAIEDQESRLRYRIEGKRTSSKQMCFSGELLTLNRLIRSGI